MKKVIVYIAMSLDGYVADKNGSVQWLNGDSSDESNFGSYPEFIEKIDTVILGYNTYQQIVTDLSPDSWPYAGMQSYILTHRGNENKEGIIFTSEDIGGLIERLKIGEGDKHIWICGGASVINQLIDHGLIDEYCISVIPTLLGGGVRLFQERESEQKLSLISTQSYNGITDLLYRPR